MKFTKLFASLAFAAAMALPGAATLSAQSPNHGNRYVPDSRSQRNVANTRREIEKKQREIADDRARIERDRRGGHWQAVERGKRELARDEQALDLLLRKLDRDLRELSRSYR